MNMQSPVYVLMHQNIAEICEKTISLQTSTDNMRRCTVAVTLTASGHKLSLLVIFTGKMATKKLKTYKEGPVYVCQEHAWMDQEVMFAWVEQVLMPYSQAAPSYVQPIIYLDSYSCTC